jgi:hypothetical protein
MPNKKTRTRDIREKEPALEGQIGYKGPAIIAHLFGGDR